jgi:predicted outer membrane protein
MKSTGLLAVLVFAAVTTPGFAQMGSSGVEGLDQTAGRVTGQGFLEQLMRNTAAQIEWSRIAQARTADPEIKAFAKKIEFQSSVFGYEINQRGQAVHAQFDPVVSGKLKETSDKLRTIPADQVDIAYLKSLQAVGHQTVDLLSGQYNAVIDTETKGIAVRVSSAVAKENSEAHDLLKKRRK